MKTTKKDIERYNAIKAQLADLEKEKNELREKFLNDALMFGVEEKNKRTFSVGKHHHVTVTTSFPKTFDEKTFSIEHETLYNQYIKTGKRDTVSAKIDD